MDDTLYIHSDLTNDAEDISGSKPFFRCARQSHHCSDEASEFPCRRAGASIRLTTTCHRWRPSLGPGRPAASDAERLTVWVVHTASGRSDCASHRACSERQRETRDADERITRWPAGVGTGAAYETRSNEIVCRARSFHACLRGCAGLFCLERESSTETSVVCAATHLNLNRIHRRQTVFPYSLYTEQTARQLPRIDTVDARRRC